MEQIKTERERIMARILKCLRLSKSSEPHEAAAALRQAQKMMEAHSISEAEVFGTEVSNKLVVTTETVRRKTPVYLAAMITIICRAFDGECCLEHVQKGARRFMAVRYFAKGGKAELMAYAHHVIYRQLSTAWRAHQQQYPYDTGRGARAGFQLGWLEQVKEQVYQFAGNEEERAAAKSALAVHYGHSLGKAKTNRMSVDGNTHSAGRRAAEGFSIHSPMRGAGLKQIGNS